MGFKRKRGSFSLSPSSESTCSSVAGPHEATSPTPFSTQLWPQYDDDASMGGMEFGSSAMPISAMHAGASYEGGDGHLHSRTRKRFRDNRPDESVIYESTISRLFLAQRPSHSMHPPPSSEPATTRHPSLSSASASAAPPRSHQASLHSFWALPRATSVAHDLASSGPSFESSDSRRQCEDCDAWFGSSLADGGGAAGGGDGMDVDIGMALDGEDQGCCVSCGKVVCATCAVVEVGASRECLDCKTRRRRWVGGIGWVS